MPSASSPLPAVRFLDQEAVLSCCRQLAESFLATHPQVLEVGGFDPLAQGRAGPRSDVDLYLGVEELAPRSSGRNNSRVGFSLARRSLLG